MEEKNLNFVKTSSEKKTLNICLYVSKIISENCNKKFQMYSTAYKQKSNFK